MNRVRQPLDFGFEKHDVLFRFFGPSTPQEHGSTFQSLLNVSMTASILVSRSILKLTYGWRVRVRCPGCGNIVEVVMLAYTLIHDCDPDKYKPGEIVEILPPDPNLSRDWWMSANTVRRQIVQKKTGRRPQGLNRL